MNPKGFDFPGSARQVPLIVWVLTLVVLILIPLKIVGYGFMPGGDALRHVAKAFTDKPDDQIVVVRSEYKVDHNGGWEWVLRQTHRALGWNADQLTIFSTVFLVLWVFLAPLPWLRRPEAWLAALLAQLVALPALMVRLAQVRPLLISEGVLIALLFAWSKPDQKGPSSLKLGLTCIGVTLSVWLHGSWYLWVLPLAAFFLARQWRSCFWLTLCWLAGTVCGALLTGHPIAYLVEAVRMAVDVFREHLPYWMLVGEFQPSEGELSSLMLLAVVFLWRRQQNESESKLLDTPAFWLVVICWILGLRADRCWVDWGIPAMLVWLTVQFEEGMTKYWEGKSLKRVVACGLIAMPLFFHSTNDLDRRYTHNLDKAYLDGSNPSLRGWMPESNGIFYSAQMGFYYDTFYKNPTADWRYILGFEPALMPKDDLKIYRGIQMNRNDVKAYEPWADKMQPADRLAISSYAKPDLPQLEWTNATKTLWIGRLPSGNSAN